MASYPSYSGKLPDSLKFWKLRHYVLLSYWVFFRPSALHGYLHQAAANSSPQKWFWRTPAYRNFYLMLPIALVASLLIALVLFVLYVTYSLQGHTSEITSLVVTPNGKEVISTSANRSLNIELPSSDSNLKIWNIENGAERQSLKGHFQGVTTVAITPDGKKAISASRDRRLKIWDLQTGKQLRTLGSHKGVVLDVAFMPDGKRALSASADGTLKLWDVNKTKELLTLTGHKDTIWAVAITPDGKKAISASGDRTLKVWDLKQGKTIYTLEGHQGGITVLKLIPNSNLVASAGSDRTVKVWNWATGKLIYNFAGHTDGIADLAVTKNSKKLVSASYDRTLKVWDLTTGKLLFTLKGHQGSITNVIVSPDQKRAISASSDSTLKVWDLETGKEIYTLKGHQDWVTALAITPDGKTIISGSFDRFPKYWTLATGQELPAFMANFQLGLLRLGMWISLILLIMGFIFSTSSLLATGLSIGGVAGITAAAGILMWLGGAVFTLISLFADRTGALTSMRESAIAPTLNTFAPIVYGLFIGIIWQTACALAGRQALAVMGSIIIIGSIGLFSGILVAGFVNRPAASWIGPINRGVIISRHLLLGFNLVVTLGTLRILYYPVQLLWTKKRNHPLSWDELLVLPLPGGQNYLQQQLERDTTVGWELINQTVSNPWQRCLVQRTLTGYLQQNSALDVIYQLRADEKFDRYITVPVTSQDAQCLPTTRQVLLGLIANQWINCGTGWTTELGENFIKFFTWWRRDRQQTPITRFTAMLIELSDVQLINGSDFDLSKYRPIYSRLTDYPGGVEIARTFEAMAAFLSYNTTSALPEAAYFGFNYQVMDHSDPTNILLSNVTEGIRPAVITTLANLGEVGKQVAKGLQTGNNQLGELTMALVKLEAIEQYANQQILSAEKAIMARIIRQWRHLLLESIAQSQGGNL